MDLGFELDREDGATMRFRNNEAEAASGLVIIDSAKAEYDTIVLISSWLKSL